MEVVGYFRILFRGTVKYRYITKNISFSLHIQPAKATKNTLYENATAEPCTIYKPCTAQAIDSEGLTMTGKHMNVLCKLCNQLPAQ